MLHHWNWKNISQPHNSTSRRWVSLIRVKEERRHSDSESNYLCHHMTPHLPRPSLFFIYLTTQTTQTTIKWRPPTKKTSSQGMIWPTNASSWSSDTDCPNENTQITPSTVNLAVIMIWFLHPFFEMVRDQLFESSYRDHPNGRLGIARRIGPNRCPKNFEPDAGFISMTSRRTIIYLCLYNVFFYILYIYITYMWVYIIFFIIQYSSISCTWSCCKV